MTVDPYSIRFAQLLRERLSEDLNDEHTKLGNGTQIVANDAAATGMKCAKAMGIIDGLKTALDRIKRVHEEMQGKDKDKAKKGQFE